MKKVGILGGTFNPPHIGHLILANEVFHALELVEVRIMPNAEAPHKKVVSLPNIIMPKNEFNNLKLKLI